ncbi:hypothetical protein VPH35_009488 [Triticum aestivum]
MDPQPIFDFDLNQAPPSDDGRLTVDARTAGEPSPSALDDGGTDDALTAPRQGPWAARKPSPPPPDVDETAYALSGREPLPPPDGMGDGSTWAPEMLVLDVSLSLTDDDEDGDDEVEGEIESRPPSSYDLDAPRSPAPTRSPEKSAGSCSPEHHAEVAVAPPTARAYSQSAIDMGAARPSSCMDVDGTAPLSRRYDGRSSRPNSEAKPTRWPFLARTSSGSSPSRAHAKGTSDTSSSHLSRRLVRRDEGTPNHPGDYDDDMLPSHGGMRRTPPRHGPAMRGQEAPRRYKPYYEHDERGHRGNEEPHGYRGHGHRGYETQNFSAQQGYSSSSKRFAGRLAREEDSYGGRQIPAQQVQGGGYRQHREPPGAHFPAAKRPYHQYARDAGEVDGDKQAGREHRPYQHRRNGYQEKKPQAQARGPAGRRRQYYEDAYTNS